MTGSNCALFGCSTSRTSDLSLFKIPSVRKADGDEDEGKEGNCPQRMASCGFYEREN